MYGRILVPLDGSALAEHALPVAARLAKARGSILILARVAETPSLMISEPPDARETLALPLIEAERAEAKAYLSTVQRSGTLAGIRTETIILDGPVAAAILDAAQKHHADLIVVCSHGRTGVMRWALGSVAEKLTRHASVPVLLVRASSGLGQRTTAPLRALVPLDGSSLAERAVPPAAELIAALSAPATGEVRLLHVITPRLAAQNAPPHTEADSVSAAVIAEAQDYLAAVAARLQGEIGARAHVIITSSVRLAADPAQAISNIADMGSADEHGEIDANPADCVAMATHGRSGLERWTLGSVAERVLRTSQVPLLIVPPQRAKTIHAHVEPAPARREKLSPAPA